MNRPRIYIAGPMSQGDRLSNLHDALRTYRQLIAIGYAPLCPQLTFFVDSLITLPHDAWLAIDLPWVQASDAVLRLPGASAGADMEVSAAKASGVPVFTSIADLHAYFCGRISHVGDAPCADQR